MDASAFLEAIRTDNQTALSRLGSSKALYADTRGELDDEEVLTAAATAEHHAAETFDAWAETESTAAVAEAFASTAAEERSHYETVAGQLADHAPGDPPAIQEYLRGIEGTVERLGAFVGRTLAAEESKGQLTGYFVGQADPTTAQLFRDMGEELDAQLDRAVELLSATCGDDADCWEQARSAARGAVQAAYEEYTATLEDMGVDPKPVC